MKKMRCFVILLFTLSLPLLSPACNCNNNDFEKDRIIQMQGDVTGWIEDTNIDILETPHFLKSGTTIETGQDGATTIKFRQEAICQMTSNSSLTTRLPTEEYLFQQIEGTTYIRWLGVGTKCIEIKGYGSVAPTGTAFRISLLDNITTIGVFEGVLEFTPLVGEKVEINAGKESIFKSEGIQLSMVDASFSSQEIGIFNELQQDGTVTNLPLQLYNLFVYINPWDSGSVTPSGGNYAPGTNITLRAEPKPGYTFGRWEGDISGTSPTITINMDSNKKVTACFEHETYKLNIAIDGQGTTNPESGNYTYNKGTRVTITASPAPDWYFDHWAGDASGNSLIITLTMDSDKNITAYFEHITYELSIAISGQGTTEPEPGTYTYNKGTQVTITAVPALDWYFDHWAGDVSGNSSIITVTMNSDKDIIAHFKHLTCELNIAVDGQGTTNPPPGTHTCDKGTQVIITALPTPDWYFDHWAGDVSGNSTAITITMDGDKNITAHFKHVTCILNIAIDGQGTTNPVPGTYTYDKGTQVTITASPASGWQFSHWQGDVSGNSTTITITMDSDKSVTACFELIPDVKITFIFYDGLVPQVESDEYVEIKNNEGKPVNITGWKLKDISDGYPTFIFPYYILQPGETIRVYTNQIHPEWGGFSFGYGMAIWDNTNPDTAVLYNAQGQEVSRKSY